MSHGINGRFRPSPNNLHGSGSIDSDWHVGGNLVVDGIITAAGISGSGEANTGANLGAGEGVFAGKVGVQLQFKSLVQAGNVTITSDANTVTISGSGTGGGGSGTVTTGSNTGSGQGVFQSLSGSTLIFRSLTATGTVGLVSSSATIQISGALTPATTYQDNGEQEIVVSNLLGQLHDAQPVDITVNNGAIVGPRHILNFLSGTNITITVAEDVPNDRINIAISSSAGGGSISGGSNDGAGQGVFETVNGSNLVFRSLVGSGSVSIGSGSNTISVSSSFSNAQSLGSGQPIVQNVNGAIISFKTITVSGSVSVSSGSDGQTLNISSSAVLSGSSTGSGVPSFQGLRQTNLVFSSFTGSGGTIVSTGSDGTLIISSSYTGSIGETNLVSNVGSGQGVFQQKNGVTFQFRSITASGTVSIVSGADGQTINISSSAPTFTQVQTLLAASPSPLTFNGQPLQLIGYPTASTDAASKQFVIDYAGSISNKPSVRVATTASLPSFVYSNGVNGVAATITSVLAGAISPQDGITLSGSDLDRILVKNETGSNAPYNGIYTLTVAGSAILSFVLTRALDSDTSIELAGASIFVETGSTNGATQWFLPLDQEDITVGTTALTWQQVPSFSNITFGPGLVRSGNNLNLAYGVLTGTVVQGNDSRVVNAIQSGTTAGSGIPVFSGTVGTNLAFKSLVGNGATTITENTGTIVISSPQAGAGTITGGSNDGAGQGVFETVNGSNLVFRSFVGSGSVTIGSGTNTISISSSFSNVQSLGSGQPIVQNVNGSIISFKTVTASGSISVSSGSDGQTINLSGTYRNAINVGAGQGIVQNVNNPNITFRSITASGSVSILSGSDGQTINLSSSAVISASSTGSGIPMFAGLQGTNLIFYSFTGSGDSFVSTTITNGVVTISGTFSQGYNIGAGQGVVQSFGNNVINFRSITASGSVSIVSGTDGQTINLSGTVPGPTGAVQYMNGGALGSSPSVIVGPSGQLSASTIFYPSSSYASASFGVTGSLTGGFVQYSGKTFDGVQQPLLQGALQTYRVPAYDPGWMPFDWRPATSIAGGGAISIGFGITLVSLGTVTSSQIMTGSFLATLPSTWISGGAANAFCDIFSGIGSNGLPICCVGANPGEGGVYIVYKFSIPIDPVSSSMFCGLGAVMPGGTTTPSSRSHHLGISFEQTDNNSSSYYFSHRGDNGQTQVRFALTSSTPGVRADLLRSSSSYGEQAIILEMLNPPGSASNWYVRIRTQQSASSYTEIFNGIITSSLPLPGYGLVTETYIRGNNASMRYFKIAGAYGGGFMI